MRARAATPWLVGGALLAACSPGSASTPAAEPPVTGAGGAPPAAPVDGAQRACVYGASDLRPCEEDCDRRLAFSCALLAARIERGIETTDGGVERDLPRALLLHERACELLDVASCSNAARMVAAGAGAPPSRRRQVELLEKACRLGDALACTVPARAYANGTGVARDPARATALWERACASGAAAACGEVDAGD